MTVSAGPQSTSFRYCCTRFLIVVGVLISTMVGCGFRSCPVRDSLAMLEMDYQQPHIHADFEAIRQYLENYRRVNNRADYSNFAGTREFRRLVTQLENDLAKQSVGNYAYLQYSDGDGVRPCFFLHFSYYPCPISCRLCAGESWVCRTFQI